MTAQGVSFRHAVELLRESSPSLGVLAEPKSPGVGPVVRSTAAKLPALVAPDAADRTLGYRLPSSQVQAGRALRARLRDLGLEGVRARAFPGLCDVPGPGRGGRVAVRPVSG